MTVPRIGPGFGTASGIVAETDAACPGPTKKSLTPIVTPPMEQVGDFSVSGRLVILQRPFTTCTSMPGAIAHCASRCTSSTVVVVVRFSSLTDVLFLPRTEPKWSVSGTIAILAGTRVASTVKLAARKGTYC